jgi:adenylate cyclase
MADDQPEQASDASMERRIAAGRKRLRRTLGQLGWARVVITALVLVLAVFVARLGGNLPIINDFERAMFDFRATVAAPHVQQDKRILLVTYNDEILIERKVRSPLDRALLADALAALDRMGAKSIGIDILIDQATDNDDKLRAQLRAMRTPTFVAFAEPTSNPNNIQLQQSQFLSAFLESVTTPVTRPASIRLSTDADDTYRRWPGRAPGTPQLMTVAMAQQDGFDDSFARYRGAVRWRLPAIVSTDQGVDAQEVFENIPITTYTNPLMLAPENFGFIAEQVRGRHILIGGDIIDNDEFVTPLNRLPDPATGEQTKVIGLEVHAHMLAQILDSAPLTQMPTLALWAAAVLAVAAGALTALFDFRPWISAILLLLQMAVIAVVPFLLHTNGIDTLPLPVVGAALGWLLAFIAIMSAVRAVGAEEKAFAASALGKYLPVDIAKEIMRDPERLALHGEKKPIYCLFSDLQGFTEMSHQLTPEKVAFVLNAYLDTLSEVVLKHGGTLDKFVGDAVVAFWGAPVSRPDDGARALAALKAMTSAGEEFGTRMAAIDAELPPIGRTRVGLHHGEAVVGNFGGEGRIQYTALGDSMNTAARLEAANKPMKTRALASAEAIAGLDTRTMTAMGRICLRGRAQPVDVFEPRPDLSDADRGALSRLVAAHAAGKGRDYAAALAEVRALLAQGVQGESIAFLIERLEATGPGEAYALG